MAASNVFPTALPVIIDKDEFYRKLEAFYKEKPNKRPFSKQQQSTIIQELQAAKLKQTRKERRVYHLLKTYDVHIVDNKSHLIKKSQDKGKTQQIIAYEDLYETLYEFHVNKTGHGGRLKIDKAMQPKFKIPRPAIETFLSCCHWCNAKKYSARKTVKRPTFSRDFCARGQVEVIDFQSLPDGEFKFILSYQDHSTKMLVLRALKTNWAEEVANQLLSVFLLFGAPKILQSNDGPEFVNNILSHLKNVWPECVIVRGRTNHSDGKDGVEQTNQDVEDRLRAWMRNTSSNKWSVGLNFVQFQKNCAFDKTIGRSPYTALFRCHAKVGINSSKIPPDLLSKLRSEEDLEELVESVSDDGASESSDFEPGHEVGLHGSDKSHHSLVASEVYPVAFLNLELDSGVHVTGSKSSTTVDDSVNKLMEVRSNINNTSERSLSFDACAICGEKMILIELTCSVCFRNIHYNCSTPSVANSTQGSVILCRMCANVRRMHEERMTPSKRIRLHQKRCQ